MLTGARIERVRRVGKTIVMDLGRGGAREADPPPVAKDDKLVKYAQFLVHLGMTGRLLVSQPEVALPPHTHAVLSLSDDGREVRFVDPRRFGRLSIVRAGGWLSRPWSRANDGARSKSFCEALQGPQAGD